jgi:U3 small nucleolar RNA-associated protein 20
MMASTSSGRIVKNSRGKKGTAHQKNHRWESFTSKIAKLNSLDPLRRVRRHDLDAEDLEKTTSYFKNSLENWQELNVSGLFVEFVQQTLPLCDSLPQILHFENKIMDLLVSSLEMKDRESMEPLLELLTDFAHDLGTRFEKHYARALALVTSIVSTPRDVEVVEWSFTCLAFLFKYLSKLLVLDLRPTYDLMAPLLGKQRQQPHIARFAAEAMSFLIKKAGAPAVRDKALKSIILHAKTDLLGTFGSREYGLYYHGMMTMLAEAVKGNGLSVHSSGVAIIKCMFAQFDGSEVMGENQRPWSDVICGVLVSSVHHTSSDTFEPVVTAVLEESKRSQDSFKASQSLENFQALMLSSKAIGVIAGVRKGSRIKDWPTLLKSAAGVLDALATHAKIVSSYEEGHQLWHSPIMSIAIVLQYAPMDAVIPFVSGYLSALAKDPMAPWFLTFCSYFAQVDADRFRSIVFSFFQRYDSYLQS